MDDEATPGPADGAPEDPTDADGPEEAPATWCEICRRHVEPDEVADDGTCPSCGGPLTRRKPLTWKFKLVALASVVYLGYRAYQGIGWLIHHA